MYENLNSFIKGFLDVSTSSEVSTQPMLHIYVSNDHTMLINLFYVITFLDFFVWSSVLFMTGWYLFFEDTDFLELFFNIWEVMVHFNILKEGETIVLICWHGLNLKYLFCWSFIIKIDLIFAYKIPHSVIYSFWIFLSYEKSSHD
jgi:hypothetical protein